MAVGLGAAALTSITLLAPVTFSGHVASPGSIDDSGNRGMVQPYILLRWLLLPQQLMVKEL